MRFFGYVGFSRKPERYEFFKKNDLSDFSVVKKNSYNGELHFYTHKCENVCSTNIVKISGNRALVSFSSCIGQAYENGNNQIIDGTGLPLTQQEHGRFRESVWGEYIIITYDYSGELIISRSPTCQIPVYFLKTAINGFVFSNDINLITSFVDSELELNFQYMAASLYDNTLLGTATPFNDIAELPLGCEVFFNENQVSVKPWWHSEKFVDKCKDIDPVDLIYKTLNHAIEVKLKYTKAKNIFLDFSGGVDSTALHFTLTKNLQPGQKYYPVHVYNDENHASNEKEIARRIVMHKGAEDNMIELNYLDFLPCSPPQLDYLPAKPSFELIYNKQYRKYYDVASLKSADSEEILFVNGHGGDNMLMSFPYYDILTDYILTKGFRGLGGYITDFAAFFRTNYYEALLGASKGLWPFLTGRTIMDKDPYFKAPWLQIDPLYIKQNQNLKHPVVSVESGILPGKQRQIMDFYEVLFLIYSPHTRHPGNYTFYPFLSQNFVELVLSMPTYKLFQKNIDRYPIRKAISENFDCQHIWRTDKGEFSNINMLGVEENYNYVRDLVMNGYFVNQSVIDKEVLEDSISAFIAGDESLQWPLLRLINLEMFVECWKR